MPNSRLQEIQTHRYFLPIFFFLLACVGLFQASFTELFHDEAYYWMWSRELSWGYYDHPPMIAWLIRFGTELLPHELGVRFFPVILHLATLYLLYLLTDKKYPLVFFTLLLAAPFVQIAGLLAVPDSPFIFFTALYLYFYRAFLEKEDWTSTILLALAVTGMLYSKYHSGMVLFFTLLSQPKLLINKKFWAIVGISFLLYFPHLTWAYQHGFDTLKYHLLGRTRSGYKIDFTLNYLLGELAAAGGILGIWVFYAAFKQGISSPFTRSLKWICGGIFLFLFTRTFSQHVEANWAASAFLPLFLLAYQGISAKPTHFHWIYKIGFPTIALLFVARLFLVWNFLPASVYKIRNEFHYWDKWTKEIQQLAGNKAVIFSNTYQYPSKYMFYANYRYNVPTYLSDSSSNRQLVSLSTSLNSAHYRHNQYDIATYEEQLQGKDVLWLMNYPFEDSLKSIYTSAGEQSFYAVVANFHSFNKVKISTQLPKKTFKPNEIVTLPLTLMNGYPYPCNFSACENFPTCLGVSFWQKEVHKWEYSQTFCENLAHITLQDTLNQSISFKMPPVAGEYDMTVLLQLGKVQTGYNAPFFHIIVE